MAEVCKYVIGDGFRLKATFTVDDVVTDPTTVTFKLKDPDGLITTYVYGVNAEVVKVSTGIYYIDVTVSKALTWFYRIVGTGAVIAATEGTFVGLQSQFD